MTMANRYNVRNIVLLLIFMSIFSTGCTNAAANAFEEYADDYHFIAARGTFADTIDQEWKNTIVDCWANITGPSYYKFDKSIKSIGSNNEFLIVYLGSAYKREVNDSRIDEMYQKIESYCEENVGMSEVPVVFMWAEDEDDLVMVYDPDAFENAKNSSNFVAAMGTVPVFADEDEWLEWSEKVHEAGHVYEMEPYFASYGGPLVSYGFKRYSAYIEVGVNQATPEKVNDSSINEIYQIFFNHYKEVGISDIPVVFVWSDVPQEDGAEDVSTESTPGFTSIMLSLTMLFLVIIRNKRA